MKNDHFLYIAEENNMTVGQVKEAWLSVKKSLSETYDGEDLYKKSISEFKNTISSISYLKEGITFFKNSERVAELARLMRVKLSASNDKKEVARYFYLIKELERISTSMAKTEKKYADKDISEEERKEIKRKYENYSAKLNEVIKHSGAEVSATLKGIGFYLLVGLIMRIITTVLFVHDPDSGFLAHFAAMIPAFVTAIKVREESVKNDIDELTNKLEAKLKKR